MKSSPRYDYQIEVREFIAPKPIVGMFSFYGAGKTYQSLQWIYDRIGLGEYMLPGIILCPDGLPTQWGYEIEKHSDFSYSVVEGHLAERRRSVQKEVDLFVVPYSSIRSGLRHDLNILSTKCNTIIADESTNLKSTETLRFKLSKAYFSAIRNRAILTGKPYTEKLQDLWAQMFWLDHGVRLGKSYWQFMKDYFDPDPFKPFGVTLKKDALERVTEKIKDICIHVPREKVAEQLPPRLFVPVLLEMPTLVRKQYQELKKNFRLEFDSGAIVDTQWAMVKSAKLHQICQGFMYIKDNDPEKLDCPKYKWLRESVLPILSDGPLLIWAYHRNSIFDICALLDELHISHGRVMGKDDHEAITRFKDGTLNCLVLSISAAFSGHNLQRAKSAIFFSEDYSGDHMDNALHRNYRQGSEMHDKIIVYQLLMDNSIDTVVHKAYQEKIDIGDALLKYLTRD